VHSTLRGIAGIFTAGHLVRRASTGMAATVLLVAGLVLPGAVSQAGQERYEYDPIGRLVRFVDSNNQVTDYRYDAAGNILSVTRASSASLAPSITAVAPSVIRRGEARAITLTGQRLDVGTLQTSDAGMVLNGVTLGATQVTANLAVSQSVPTGTQTLTFSNALGTATIGMLIAPRLPVLTVEPSPLALPPDNTARQITIRLSSADVVDHGIAIASSDTAKATVSPANVVVAAGQTTALVSVTPKVAGFLNITLTSGTLGTLTVPVFVTADFRGVNTSQAAAVGVQVGELPGPGPSLPPVSATFASPRVGLAVGPVLTNVSPRGFAAPGIYTLAVGGSNLPAGLQAAMLPSQGTTVAITSSGAQSLALSLDVSGSAAPGKRRLVVTDSAGNLVPFADPSQAEVLLTAGQPVIDSIEPLMATPGTALTLKVRGQNLHNGKLLISPAIDLRIDAEPVVNAAGTELLAGIHIAPLAAAGPRTVQVLTPSGQTTSTVNVANQFTIVSEVRNAISPIAAPLVGVVVGSSGAGGTTTVGPVAAAPVGLVVGPAAYATTPSVALIGSTATVTVTGTGLQAVQTATIASLDGLTVGAFSVNAEGTTLTMPIAVSAGATRGPRRVLLLTATGRVLFTGIDGDQLQIVAPPPTIISTTPQVIAAGSTVMMTVRGQNFTDVAGVQFVPPEALTAIGPFVATEGNTVLSFSVQAGAAAATGQRTLIVNTAGGPSSSVPSPANTFQVAQQVGPTYSSIGAPLVGVTVGASAPQVTNTLGLHSPLVGVVVESSAPQPTRTQEVTAYNVGVVVGVAASGIAPRSPEGFLKGSSGTVVVSGFALDQVNAVTASGSGVSIGSFTVNGDGTQLTVPVGVAAGTASGQYSLQLRTGTGTATARITAVDPAAMLFSVGALPTALDSMSPIVLEQGKPYTFTVRGTNLRDVYQVQAEPPEGVEFGTGGAAPQWSTDSFGEKLTVKLLIHPSAAIGSRVVRLRVPGGITDSQATPANTITIVAPQ
jgi:YD repeat-containing protein